MSHEHLSPKVEPSRPIIQWAAVLFAVLLVLGGGEVLFRLLPVSTGLETQPVDAENPVFHFAPNRPFLWSRDWNFPVVNRGRTNNDGFVNDQAYAASGPRPLIGVVGDSYVEALMVPAAETYHGRMAAALATHMRVYSFAASGAPLSQYLVWMRHARQAYGVDALIVNVVGNDFDESLAEYKTGPGFYHYADHDGELELRRFDYKPSWLGIVGRHSALFRYLIFHLHADATIKSLLTHMGIPSAQAEMQSYVGNVAVTVTDHHNAQSLRAIQAFFRDLPAFADLPPQRILFVVDGVRYPGHDPQGNSYFSHMRNAFMAEARQRGYAVMDADEIFFPYASAHPNDRFEWSDDGHWNSLTHGLVAQAILASGWLEQLGR